MNVAIIKYNAGNIFSVDYALRRLGITPVITADKELLLKADKIIFPGVGEARNTMQYLRDNQLDRLIKELKQPVLGICLGMQLMCKHSEEGNVDCLGIFDAEVKRFQPLKHEDKIPHMGWNTISHTNSDLFRGFNREEYVYFVHSYYVPLLRQTTFCLTVLHCIKITFMQHSFILRKVVKTEKEFSQIFSIYKHCSPTI